MFVLPFQLERQLFFLRAAVVSGVNAALAFCRVTEGE